MNLEAPHSFDGRKVGSPWSCDTKKIRDKLPGFYDVLIWTRRERERTVSWNVQIDLNWSNLFFETFCPWNLGNFLELSGRWTSKGVRKVSRPSAQKVNGSIYQLLPKNPSCCNISNGCKVMGKHINYGIPLIYWLFKFYLPVFCQLTCLRHFHVPNLLGSLMWIGGMLEVLSWWHWRAQQPTEKDTGSLGAMSSTRKEDSWHRHRHWWLGLKNRVPQKKTTNLGPL